MTPIIAVDLGNTRAKFGFFSSSGTTTEFPMPDSIFHDKPGNFEPLVDWLDSVCPADRPVFWCIARTGGFPWDDIQRKLKDFRPRDSFKILGRWDVPCAADVLSQEKVGIDRLLAAFGSVLWWKSRPENKSKESLFLVVDAGSATTIDLVTTRAPEPFIGSLGGGAIIPGMEATASSLSQISPKLPKTPTKDLSFASYPGCDTEEALAAGIFWGAVGTVLHFHRMVQTTLDEKIVGTHDIPIFLAGGDAEKLWNGLSLYFDRERLILLPHLVMSAIALTANFSSVAPPA